MKIDNKFWLLITSIILNIHSGFWELLTSIKIHLFHLEFLGILISQKGKIYSVDVSHAQERFKADFSFPNFVCSSKHSACCTTHYQEQPVLPTKLAGYFYTFFWSIMPTATKGMLNQHLQMSTNKWKLSFIPVIKRCTDIRDAVGRNTQGQSLPWNKYNY